MTTVRPTTTSLLFAAIAATAMALSGSGCSCGGDTSGAAGVGGSNAQGTGGGSGGYGGELFNVSSSTGVGGQNSACDPPCDPGEICTHNVCLPQGMCNDDNDCDFDTYCDEPSGLCLPWDDHVPPHDDECLQLIVPGILAPSVQCEFDTAPDGDAFPNHVDVQGTPIVFNVNKPASSGPPSIAASFTATVPDNYTENLGVIRVIRGDDCTLIANLGGTDLDGDQIVDWTVSSATLAAGDLDGDGVAEIVAYGNDGSTLAFSYTNGAWGFLWKADYPAGAPWTPCNSSNNRCSLGWAGPAIHDIDDDGIPEILREGVVLSNTGMLLSMQPSSYASYHVGIEPVLANLDQDANVEMTNGDYVWEWSQGGWVEEGTFPGASASEPSLPAVADFGAYGAGLPANAPEIAVVRLGSITIYAMDGTLVQGPMQLLPNGGTNQTGRGGPPTISDFDGDGLVELAVAGRLAYTVFDIDCGPNPRPGGTCPNGPCDTEVNSVCPTGIAWSRATQDASSNVTGSSVFDFEADGNAEVVYGDECFVRVYDGSNGDVLFSQYRSSCTWHENPIIADTDGDFRAEMVSPSNKACSNGGLGVSCSMLNADGVDIQFNGLRCDVAGDCSSGSCDAGLCRCVASAECCAATSDAECIEQGYKCSPPEAGTMGSGNTCRAAHPHGLSGIRVYNDANDQWVKSRTIWNQHAYAVTHVNEDGTIPSTSNWLNNWDDPELNNFRQNVPGDPNGNAIGDGTAGASQTYGCSGTGVNLQIDVCNRGAAAIAPGMPVGFYVAGNNVCSTTTTVVLQPEECESVNCLWATPPAAANQAVDVTVIANDGGALAECKEGNNEGVVLNVFCKPAG